MVDATDSEAVDRRYRRLRVFNAVVGLILLIEAVLMLVLSSDFALPVTTNYLGNNIGRRIPMPVTREVAQLRVGPMVAIFLFISGAALLLIASPGIFSWYKKNLGKGTNYGRWMEYAFSASLMIVVIAMLSGVYDLSTLILLFTLNAMMILFGWMMELHNQTTEKTNWTAFYFGCIAGIVPWVIILSLTAKSALAWQVFGGTLRPK